MAKSSRVPVKTVPAPAATESPAPAAAARTAHPLATLRSEIDRLFDDFSTGWGRWPLARGLFDDRLWRMPALEINAPAVDVTETDKAYTVSAELPGMDEKDIEVTLSDDQLTIKGEKRQEKDERRKGYHLTERRYGMFQRSFGLPAGVDPSKISAEFARGVLTLTLPKSAEAQKKQPRRIEVKGS